MAAATGYQPVPPDIVGVRGRPLNGIPLQVFRYLNRRLVGKSLAHQCRHSRHVGRRLAGAAETFGPSLFKWCQCGCTAIGSQ